MTDRRSDAEFCKRCKEREKKRRQRERERERERVSPAESGLRQRPPRPTEPVGAAVDKRYRVVAVATGDGDCVGDERIVTDAWSFDDMKTYFADRSRGSGANSRTGASQSPKRAARGKPAAVDMLFLEV
jgi:hypothetical protein